MYIFRFAINGNHLGIPIEDIIFIEGRWKPGARESGTPAYIKEIILLHGIPVPIYDLASQFGYDEPKMEYVVAINVENGMIGLAISGVSEIIAIDDSAIHPIPAVVSTARHFIKGIVFYHGNLISLIDVNRLITLDTGCPGGATDEI